MWCCRMQRICWKTMILQDYFQWKETTQIAEWSREKTMEKNANWASERSLFSVRTRTAFQWTFNCSGSLCWMDHHPKTNGWHTIRRKNYAWITWQRTWSRTKYSGNPRLFGVNVTAISIFGAISGLLVTSLHQILPL